MDNINEILNTYQAGHRKKIELHRGSLVSGGTNVFDMPANGTYHQILIKHSAAITVAEIEKVRLKVNGRMIWEKTGAEVNAENMFMGKPDDATRNTTLVVDFERPYLLDPLMHSMSAIGMGQGKIGSHVFGVNEENRISDCKLEVDVAAACGDAVETDLAAFAVKSAPAPAGLIKRVRRFTLNVGAAGLRKWRDLSNQSIGLLEKITFSSAVVTNLRITRNEQEIHDLDKTTNDEYMESCGFVPAAGSYVFMPCASGFKGQEIPVDGTDFCCELTCSGADTALEVIVETLEPSNA